MVAVENENFMTEQENNEEVSETMFREALCLGGKDPLGYCKARKAECAPDDNWTKAEWDRIHDDIKASIDKQGMKVPYSAVSLVD